MWVQVKIWLDVYDYFLYIFFGTNTKKYICRDCDEENGFSKNETVLILNLMANLIFRGGRTKAARPAGP